MGCVRLPMEAAVIALALLGCAPAGNAPLSPAEKEQILRAAQARGLRNDVSAERCSQSTRTTQVEARDHFYNGADAFGAKGCGPER